MVGFLFGGNTNETPQTLARKRQIAEALVARSSAPRNVGEGLSSIGNALIYRALMSRADKAEKAGQESAASDFAPLLGGFGSSTPGATGSAMPRSDASGNVPPVKLSDGEVYDGFMNEVKKGITNPYGLAAVAATGNAESGFSPGNVNRTWSDPSESGKPGTAGGIMSWRGPRYEALAATGDLSPAGQGKFFLSEDPNLITALNNAKSVEEAQNLMNRAWAFRGYDRPGGEAARRLAGAQGYLPQFQGQGGGQQVASLDPSAGMPDTTSAYVDPMVTTDYRAPAAPANIPVPTPRPSAEVAQALLAPQKGGRLGAPQPLPDDQFNARFGTGDATGSIPPQIDTQSALAPLPVTEVGPTPNVASVPPVADTGQQPAQPNQQVAQALLKPQPQPQQTDANTGYFPAAPNPPGQSGPSQAQIMRVLTNPFASESQKAVAQALLQRNLDASDPDAQLNRDYKRAQIAQLTGKQAGYQVLTPAERKQLGIPDTDQRIYQRGPNGQIDAVGGVGQTINIGNEVDQRRLAASQAGLKPEDPGYQGFILTGKLPKENEQNLTATDKKAILEADEMVQNTQNVLPLLDRALELNDKAYSGPGAGIRSTIMGVTGDEGALATQELDNVVTAGALQQLKAIFGGAPTEGERAILLDMSGASSKPPEVRKSIYQRARQLAERRLQFYKDRANDMRGGNYYKPGETQQMPSVPDAPVAAPQQPAAAADPLSSMPAPAGMDENIWKFVPPEERKLWLKK